MVDGFTRIMGITTLGIDTVLAHPNPALRNSPWAMVAVATLAGGGGGMIVPAFQGFGPEWSLAATPAWVKNGPGIDIWGATVIGYVYAYVLTRLSMKDCSDNRPYLLIYSTLIDAHPFFRLLPAALFDNVPLLSSIIHLPKGYLTSKSATPLLPLDEAKM